ncbi:MAG: hypothetical protein QNJ70_23500 [Xenococcaceae cyanobacterium MO_207.B15]|nr:hypothetical protein [Xenococcaceae cyanobacterium MO_207.B15]MDJ0743890.1 hypothetical protein [Xenococcaceae cyanobacterium MO_167.B27]
MVISVISVVVVLCLCCGRGLGRLGRSQNQVFWVIFFDFGGFATLIESQANI